MTSPRVRESIVTDVRLRDALPTDADFVFDTLREAIGPYMELWVGWDEAGERARQAERWGRLRFRVIVVDGVDAGYISTAIYGDMAAGYPTGFYLHQLMIRGAFQSKGIGSICLRRLQAEARDLGLPLNLRVLRVNPRALAFYLASGCQLVGESDTHISVRCNG